MYVNFSDEHDLQTAIKVPFEDPQLYFDSGEDGFPAFGIKPGSDIKSPYRLFLPEKLYPEFSIVFNFKLNSLNGGFLFAVVNPLENVSIILSCDYYHYFFKMYNSFCISLCLEILNGYFNVL